MQHELLGVCDVARTTALDQEQYRIAIKELMFFTVINYQPRLSLFLAVDGGETNIH